ALEQVEKAKAESALAVKKTSASVQNKKPAAVAKKPVPKQITKSDDNRDSDDNEDEDDQWDDEEDDGTDVEEIDIPDEEFEKVVGADLYADNASESENGGLNEDNEDDGENDDDSDNDSAISENNDRNELDHQIDELAMQDAIVSLKSAIQATKASAIIPKKSTAAQVKEQKEIDAIRKATRVHQSQLPSTGVVYLGRIPHGFYEKEMKSYFSQFGTVLRLRLSRNKKTGASRHFAFIEFETPQIAQIVADTMQGYLLFSHVLQCKVVPWENLHSETFKGWDTKFKTLPTNKIERARVNKLNVPQQPLTPATVASKIQQLVSREQKKRKQLEHMGIDYDFDGFSGLAAASSEKKVKTDHVVVEVTADASSKTNSSNVSRKNNKKRTADDDSVTAAAATAKTAVFDAEVEQPKTKKAKTPKKSVSTAGPPSKDDKTVSAKSASTPEKPATKTETAKKATAVTRSSTAAVNKASPSPAKSVSKETAMPKKAADTPKKSTTPSKQSTTPSNEKNESKSIPEKTAVNTKETPKKPISAVTTPSNKGSTPLVAVTAVANDSAKKNSAKKDSEKKPTTKPDATPPSAANGSAKNDSAAKKSTTKSPSDATPSKKNTKNSAGKILTPPAASRGTRASSNSATPVIADAKKSPKSTPALVAKATKNTLGSATKKTAKEINEGASENVIVNEFSELSKNEIVNLVNNLSEQGLVEFVTVGKQLLFKARDENEAIKTRDLSQTEIIIYNLIKNEKSKGIWTKEIKTKSGLHQQIVNECIKSLEKLRLIKGTKSVKHPTRKLYILFDLAPSEELTGGAWYTDSELDVPFIEGLAEMTFKFISTKSWPKSTTATIAVSGTLMTSSSELIFPPDHQAYATTSDVHNFLKRSGVLKISLTLEDVQMLVDRLWYDGKIVRIRRAGAMGDRNHMSEDDDDDDGEDSVVEMWMYRAVRGESVGHGQIGSGTWGGTWWSEIPCGKCNVSGFCKSGGPVSPEGCVYFNKWLDGVVVVGSKILRWTKDERHVLKQFSDCETRSKRSAKVFARTDTRKAEQYSLYDSDSMNNDAPSESNEIDQLGAGDDSDTSFAKKTSASSLKKLKQSAAFTKNHHKSKSSFSSFSTAPKKKGPKTAKIVPHEIVVIEMGNKSQGIDKLLSWKPAVYAADGYFVREEDVLVKYKYHAEWLSKTEIEADRMGKMRLQKFLAKPLFETQWSEEEPFNPSFKQMDRIIDDGDNNGEVMYLVKWCSQTYDFSTWVSTSIVQEVDDSKFRSYQNEGVRPSAREWSKMDESPSWYNNQKSILADEMGLGKTVQSTVFLDYIYTRCNIKGPFLVIAPLSTIGNWERELNRWSDMNVVVYHGRDTARNLIVETEFYYRDNQHQIVANIYKFDVILTTYEMAASGMSQLRPINWRCIVLDEAHRLKYKASKISEVLKQYKMEHRMLLTGTPLQNSLDELWALLNFYTLRNSEREFQRDFRNLSSAQDVEKLQALLKPLMLRRLKENVEKSIPIKEETIIDVLKQGADKKSNVPNLINAMMELRKCCSHPFLLDGAEAAIIAEYNTDTPEKQFQALAQASGKIVLIDKLLRKLKQGGYKVLIFSQMTRCLDLIQDYLRGQQWSFERIDGSVRGDLWRAAIDRFSALGCETFAGGVGINLTAADTVIIFDSDWNPKNDLQAQSRVYRIGQK
ncbi:Chromodomain helicase DNA binding protein, partial [Physocladia obscura]